MEAQRDLVEDSRELDPLVSLFRLLSDKTRMQILLILARGERNVGSLCDELRLPQPTVSHHLGLLRSKSLILNRRNGKQVFYALDDHVVVDPSGQMSIQSPTFNIRIGDPTLAGDHLGA
jgi:DNA-binding transcriptional ArsR family regulator